MNWSDAGFLHFLGYGEDLGRPFPRFFLRLCQCGLILDLRTIFFNCLVNVINCIMIMYDLGGYGLP